MVERIRSIGLSDSLSEPVRVLVNEFRTKINTLTRPVARVSCTGRLTSYTGWTEILGSTHERGGGGGAMFHLGQNSRPGGGDKQFSISDNTYNRGRGQFSISNARPVSPKLAKVIFVLMIIALNCHLSPRGG